MKIQKIIDAMKEKERADKNFSDAYQEHDRAGYVLRKRYEDYFAEKLGLEKEDFNLSVDYKWRGEISFVGTKKIKGQKAREEYRAKARQISEELLSIIKQREQK